MSIKRTERGVQVSKKDLGMAYRKAKVDLFYSSRVCARELLDFETELESNLTSLRTQLRRGRVPEVTSGSWTVVPKAINVSSETALPVESDAASKWGSIRNAEGAVEAHFRVMEALPVAYHVFATLWLHKVGHMLEARLSSSVMGNRLRRKESGELNLLSIGSCPPYLHSYSKWRDDGMVAIRAALDDNRDVIAMTADVNSFYHRLDASFLLDDSFLALLGVELSPEEWRLHELFVESLCAWAAASPLGRGLPVGLVASSVIANLSLFELDLLIESEAAPLYYGRYVDDLILVVENGRGLKEAGAVWAWLCERLQLKLSAREDGGGECYEFCPSYLGNSKVEFSGSKNRLFMLRGPGGKALLTAIEKQIKSQASEWQALPELPFEGPEIESNLLTAIQQSGDLADNLRKADQFSVQRGALARKLRDVEAYGRALRPEAWSDRRHAFIEAFVRNVLVLPTFFQFYGYLPRVVKIAGENSDFAALRLIVNALEDIHKELQACKVLLAGQSSPEATEASQDVLTRFTENVRQVALQSIQSSVSCRANRAACEAWDSSFGGQSSLIGRVPLRTIARRYTRYLRADLASRPLKQLLLPSQLTPDGRMANVRGLTSSAEEPELGRLVDGAVMESARVLSSIGGLPISKGALSGLVFPTRPLSAYELYLAHSNPFSDEGAEQVKACLLGARGFTPARALPKSSGSAKGPVISIPHGRAESSSVRIAVTSWKTELDSWVAALTGNPDPDVTRLDRLNRLLSSVISCRERPDYLVLPECSLPPGWFVGAALRLQRMGISLVAGVEYQRFPPSTVRSQIWAALCSDVFGFPTMTHYSQDKQRPAPHEEYELNRIGGRQLVPEKEWPTPPILNHGGFHFALLMCSELTNIQYRADLRGRVDGILVPEWNQDTDSFSALVESAALDVHAYIVQCNDREYGDSRIRAPFKNSWERDLVRVKGGLEDYFVVAEVDVFALRQFQSNHRSPSGPFKPVPDGFSISPERRVMPKP